MTKRNTVDNVLFTDYSKKTHADRAALKAGIDRADYDVITLPNGRVAVVLNGNHMKRPIA